MHSAIQVLDIQGNIYNCSEIDCADLRNMIVLSHTILTYCFYILLYSPSYRKSAITKVYNANRKYHEAGDIEESLEIQMVIP